MTESNTAHRAETLRQEINRHNHLYHVLDRPEIGDGQFDALFEELREIERQRPDLVTQDSPTQRVGAELSDGFSNVRHPTPMLSLSNALR